MSTSAVIRLPFPPGSNNAYPGKGKRYKSPELKVWRRAAGKLLSAQRARKFTEPVTVLIELYRPDDRLRDVDNRIKATLDLLVLHRILLDDNWRHLQSVTATWAGLDRKDPRAVVTVQTVEAVE